MDAAKHTSTLVTKPSGHTNTAHYYPVGLRTQHLFSPQSGDWSICKGAHHSSTMASWCRPRNPMLNNDDDMSLQLSM
eukprot:scaffold28305_cov17-Prasinocladus_malaysianus.AAC.1